MLFDNDKEDDWGSDFGGSSDLCNEALLRYYQDCDFSVGDLEGPQAVEQCNKGGAYWDCFLVCYGFVNNCEDFAGCVADCEGSPLGDDDDATDDDADDDTGV
jgi:hypothetical protein